VSKLFSYAKAELQKCGYFAYTGDGFEPARQIAEDVLELIEAFSDQDHSGFSAPMCLAIFNRLAHRKPLSPLTGEDDEWVLGDLNDKIYFNKRYFSVIKDEHGDCYDIDGIVFEDEFGNRYTNKNSRVKITFPYVVPNEPEVQKEVVGKKSKKKSNKSLKNESDTGETSSNSTDGN